MTRLFQIAFWAAAISAFTLAVVPQPSVSLAAPGDKLQHIFAFVVLAVLAMRAYPRVPPLGWLVILSLFGGAIELAQLLPITQRDGDVADWIVDTVATAGTIGLILQWRRLRGADQVDS